jgi:two-component system, LytTR family, response regulator LytT
MNSITPYRIGIIEDEPAALDRLLHMLQDGPSPVTVAWTSDSVAGSLIYLKDVASYDAIITDVQLADGTCFDLFELFKPVCPVIFITAYDQYAIEAFVVHAIDYLQKPLKKDQLQLAMKKLFTRLQAGTGAIDYVQLAQALSKKGDAYLRRYMIRFGEQIRIISSVDIAFIYTHQKAIYATLHSGKSYPMDKSLDQLESELDPDQFFRINRQMIVSRKSIGPMHVVSKSRVQVQLVPAFTEYESIVSTERSPLFKEWIA